MQPTAGLSLLVIDTNGRPRVVPLNTSSGGGGGGGGGGGTARWGFPRWRPRWGCRTLGLPALGLPAVGVPPVGVPVPKNRSQ